MNMIMPGPENPFSNVPNPKELEEDKEAAEAVSDAERLAQLDPERVADEVELAELKEPDDSDSDMPMAA